MLYKSVRKVCAVLGVWAVSTLVTLVLADTAAEETVPLSITVSNIESTKGSVFISVYDNADDFLSDETVANTRIWLKESLTQGQVTTELKLPPGHYAIMAYHDANDNAKLDTNFIGIPKEPGGFSNGHVPKFGPPRFSAAEFTLTAEGGAQSITLN